MVNYLLNEVDLPILFEFLVLGTPWGVGFEFFKYVGLVPVLFSFLPEEFVSVSFTDIFSVKAKEIENSLE